MYSGSYNSLADKSALQLLTGQHDDKFAALLAHLESLGYADDAADETRSIRHKLQQAKELLTGIDRELAIVKPVWQAVDHQQLTGFNEADLSAALAQFRQNNRHTLVQQGASAHCTHCTKHFGWYCPQSPDHACHYFSDGDGQVRLINGEDHAVPAGHEIARESEDCCIFCGDPEERK